MEELSDGERRLFKDWARRAPWKIGEAKENGAAEGAEGLPIEAEPTDQAVALAEPGAPAPAPEPSPALPAPEAAAAIEPRPVPAIPEARPEPPSRPQPPAAQRPARPASALSHVDERGAAHMVDVTGKADTAREAIAEGFVTMQPSTLRLIAANAMAKGDVLAVARVAGIMAAKRTSELIPLCHPLPLTGVTIEFEPASDSRVRIVATARTTAKTGVEMEALTAVGVAALTIYDMAKAVDRGMRIEGIRLLEKRGGKSGDYRAEG